MPVASALQPVARVAVTSARTDVCVTGFAVAGRPPEGHITMRPTSVASAHGTSSAAMRMRTRRPAGGAGECPWPCP